MKWLFCFALALCTSKLAAQKATTGKLTPYASGAVGLIAGEATAQGQLQLVSGIKTGVWYGGIGAAIDYYDTRSVPLFVDLRRDFRHRENTPFVYVDAGYNLLWQRPGEKTELEVDSKSGLYYDVGLGYRAALNTRLHFSIAAGFSGKTFSRKVQQPTWGGPWPQRPTIEHHRYDLHRVLIKAGLGF